MPDVRPDGREPDPGQEQEMRWEPSVEFAAL